VDARLVRLPHLPDLVRLEVPEGILGVARVAVLEEERSEIGVDVPVRDEARGAALVSPEHIKEQERLVGRPPVTSPPHAQLVEALSDLLGRHARFPSEASRSHSLRSGPNDSSTFPSTIITARSDPIRPST
jgi:hypothetical protein